MASTAPSDAPNRSPFSCARDGRGVPAGQQGERAAPVLPGLQSAQPQGARPPREGDRRLQDSPRLRHGEAPGEAAELIDHLVFLKQKKQAIRFYSTIFI